MADDLIAEGTVLDAGHQPVAGLLVQVFDQDLPSLHSDQFLAEATTDAEGRYRAVFSAGQYQANEWAGPDLYVEVRAPDGTLLGRSDTRFNAQLPARIDLSVQRPPDTRLSEYETLTVRVLPLLGALAVYQLTREDVAFL